MEDFINYDNKKKTIVLTESTAAVLAEEGIDITANTDPEEVMKKVSKSKKAVAKKTESGVVVKQSLNG